MSSKHNNTWEKIVNCSKVIYDDDSYSYFKSDDVEKLFAVGQWYLNLPSSQKNDVKRIANNFGLDPMEYDEAIDFFLDIDEFTLAFYGI